MTLRFTSIDTYAWGPPFFFHVPTWPSLLSTSLLLGEIQPEVPAPFPYVRTTSCHCHQQPCRRLRNVREHSMAIRWRAADARGKQRPRTCLNDSDRASEHAISLFDCAKEGAGNLPGLGQRSVPKRHCGCYAVSATSRRDVSRYATAVR